MALGELGHVAGLVVLLVLGALVPALAHAAVPRHWRVKYRHAHGREGARSAYISKRQRRAVFAADWHRCVYCHSTLNLQVDHVMPWSCGGRTWLPNLVTLCGRCNRVKSNYWVERNGRCVYRPFVGAANIQLAAAILEAEKRARRNPARWARAGLRLAA